MSILKLMRDRQMYKYGHRVGFEPGGMAGEHGMGAGVGRDGQTDGQRGGPPGGGDNAPPTAPTGGDIDDTYTDTSFNTTPTQQPGFFNTVGTGIKDYVMGGGMLGMGIRGLSNIFGGPIVSNGNVGPAGLKTDGTYGTIQNAINTGYRNEPPREEGGNDGQGIMNLPQPNMYATVEEVDGEEDYVQRFQVKDEFRKAKGADLGIENAAIAEMISKLYS